MTSPAIDQTVARITGESLRRIRRVGFSLPDEDAAESHSDEVAVVLNCAFCRRPIPYPGLARPGQIPLAECLICDVEFEFHLDEVYVLATPMTSLPSPGRRAC